MYCSQINVSGNDLTPFIFTNQNIHINYRLGGSLSLRLSQKNSLMLTEESHMFSVPKHILCGSYQEAKVTNINYVLYCPYKQ